MLLTTTWYLHFCSCNYKRRTEFLPIVPSIEFIVSYPYTAKACAYSCQYRLWRHAGVGEFGEFGELEGTAAPNFWPMSLVAKRLPISATAEVLFWSISCDIGRRCSESLSQWPAIACLHIAQLFVYRVTWFLWSPQWRHSKQELRWYVWLCWLIEWFRIFYAQS